MLNRALFGLSVLFLVSLQASSCLPTYLHMVNLIHLRNSIVLLILIRFLFFQLSLQRPLQGA